MTSEQAVYRRTLRRETHASRTVPAVIVAGIALLVLVAGGVAAIWSSVDAGFRGELVRLGSAVVEAARQPVLLAGTGVVLVLLAGLLVVLAVAPGRRARRARQTARTALLIDDGVIADSVAEHVARRTGTARDRVSVTIGRRAVRVRITPTSGVPVDRAVAAAAVGEVMDGIGFPATARVEVETEGVIA